MCEETKKIMETTGLDYGAAFDSKDIKMIIPTKTKKGKEATMDLTIDTFQMDIEAETDRRMLCEKILEQYNEVLAQKALTKKEESPTKPVKQAKGKAKPKKVVKQPVFNETNKSGNGFYIDSLFVSDYVCDFGHMVVGTSRKKNFRLTNTGALPVNFSFDKKALNNFGLSIEPVKVQKLAPDSS